MDICLAYKQSSAPRMDALWVVVLTAEFVGNRTVESLA